ncbi:hypothetical protein SMALB_0322 [Streptomyces malaysiensis]|uniref:Uncharacterized protein n=1 Tax=Streptomyces malaysiensis TaxID=92644 RepID=A0A7X5WWQ7_STRMQ|nr:hypothetical protein [Streptomyces malaysiensis]
MSRGETRIRRRHQGRRRVVPRNRAARDDRSQPKPRQRVRGCPGTPSPPMPEPPATELTPEVSATVLFVRSRWVPSAHVIVATTRDLRLHPGPVGPRNERVHRPTVRLDLDVVAAGPVPDGCRGGDRLLLLGRRGRRWRHRWASVSPAWIAPAARLSVATRAGSRSRS